MKSLKKRISDQTLDEFLEGLKQESPNMALILNNRLPTGTDIQVLGEEHVNKAKAILTKAARANWQKPKLMEDAREHFTGFVLSVQNNIPHQAKMHLQRLDFTNNLNSANETIRAIRPINKKAKPFAITEAKSRSFDIKGHGYTWRIIDIGLSNEIIPARHLAKLSALRNSQVQPDSLYIGAPYESIKTPLSKALVVKIQQMANSMSGAIDNVLYELGDLAKMPDPVLLVGFGQNPIVLVEIARWI